MQAVEAVAARRARARSARPARLLAAFCFLACFFEFLPVYGNRNSSAGMQHIAARVGVQVGDLADLLTPFVVLGFAAALLLSLRARRRVLLAALFFGVLYAEGHGVHLAANSIRAHTLPPDIDRGARFWDEQFGHIAWHAGFLGLLGAFVAADASRRGPAPLTACTSAFFLGVLLFVGGVEGSTWWLVAAASVGFTAVAARRGDHTSLSIAAGLVFADAMIAAWAIYWSGVPQFSHVWG